MRVIDMHLNPLTNADLTRVAQVTVDDLAEACDYFSGMFSAASVKRGVMVVLNPDILNQTGIGEALRRILEGGQFVISYCPDFRAPKAIDQIERAHAVGVRAVKFHPYLQRTEARDFPECLALARHAEAIHMLIMVCCSYGTRALDRYSGLRLAAYLSEHVSCPIVMSHAGGAEILDAMLVAEEARNLYLDTSFSLPYYLGSSVEQDFAFCMRKLGSHRWVYGSDAPFVGMTQALAATLDFLERHRFSSQDSDNLLYATAAAILDETLEEVRL